MKKIALAMMAITIGFTSFSQSKESDTHKRKDFSKGEKHFEGKKFDKLNLTEDQKAKIKTVNSSFRQQMQDLNENSNVSVEALKAKRQSLIKEHKEKINAILTAEQRKQAEDMREEFAKEHRGKMRGERFEAMTKDLHLTAEQSEKMKEINSTFRTNIKNIRQNTSLSQEERTTQLKSLMKQHKADMDALLTDEQKQQVKENHKNRRREAVK